MAGLWSLWKTWTDDETLTNEDLNSSFETVLDNAIATETEGYSTVNNVPNNAVMDSQIAPFPLGVRSYATSVAGEIQRLRYQLAQIISGGTGLWYDTPASSIEDLSNLINAVQGVPPQRALSGRTRGTLAAGFVSNQPIFLVPGGTTRTVTLKASTTPFVCYIDGTKVTVTSDLSVTNLSLAPSSNNTALVNVTGLTNTSTDVYGFPYAKIIGEDKYPLAYDTAGSNITALVGSLAAFKVVDGGNTEYFMGQVDSSTQLAQCYRGYFFNSTDAVIPRVGIADNDVISLMRLSWVFLTNVGGVQGLSVTYDNPVVAYSEPTSPTSGMYWYDLSASKWKVYSPGPGFQDAVAIMIGICIQDTTNCIAARSFDFFSVPQSLNTIKLETRSASLIQASTSGRVVVQGNLIDFQVYPPQWDMSQAIEPGVTLVNGSKIALYITDDGKPIISDVIPYNRSQDLLGLYHPDNPWRCVGFATAASASTYKISVSTTNMMSESVFLSRIEGVAISCTTANTTGFVMGTVRRFFSGKPVMVSGGGGGFIPDYAVANAAGSGQVLANISMTTAIDNFSGGGIQSSKYIAYLDATAATLNQRITIPTYSFVLNNMYGWGTIEFVLNLTNCEVDSTFLVEFQDLD